MAKSTYVICKNCLRPIEPIRDIWGYETELGWHHPHLTENSDGKFSTECESGDTEAEPTWPGQSIVPSPPPPKLNTLQGMLLACGIGAGLWAFIIWVLIPALISVARRLAQ